MSSTPASDRTRVHVTHCCVVHGCKYSNANCPVEQGDEVQEHPCEFCYDNHVNDPKPLLRRGLDEAVRAARIVALPPEEQPHDYANQWRLFQVHCRDENDAWRFAAEQNWWLHCWDWVPAIHDNVIVTVVGNPDPEWTGPWVPPWERENPS